MTLNKGWKTEESFTFWVPAHALSISKGGEGKDKGKRMIQGIASTSACDLQGEIVEQGGIDTDYFIKHGYFNNDHKPGFENKVGEPVECKVTKKGLWVKGFLYDNHPVADAIWTLMQSQESNPHAKRRIGFSIEGKVKRRSGRKIEECWIQDIAITPAPVNTTTWAEIAKSLSADWSKKDDDFEEEEKALSTASGAALVPESLDKKEKVNKALSFEEAVSLVSQETGLGHTDSATIVNWIYCVQQEQE